MREAVRHGPSSPQALTVLLEQHQESVYRFLRGFGPDAEQARDLLQDVFCDAWQAICRQTPPFDGSGDTTGIRQWLFHAAYCRAISARRRERLIVWRSLDTTEATGVEVSVTLTAYEEQFAEGEVVRAAMKRLTPDDAACLVLNVIHGFTAVEIARIVGIAPEAAKKRLSRAKQRLRDAYVSERRMLEEDHSSDAHQ
jgi:RNA polymerase sigma factor (sigma-70 family)